MIRVETKSGSVYIVDEANFRIKQIGGDHVTSRHLHGSADWQTYRSISEIEPGRPLVLTWNDTMGITITSKITATRKI